MFIVRGEEANLAKRFTDLMEHAEQLDMLAGFFYFSGIKILHDTLRERPNVKMRVLVGIDAEVVVGQLVEVVREGGANDAESVRTRYGETLRKIVSSAAVDTQEFHDRLDLFIGMLASGRLELRRTLRPNHSKLYLFHMDETAAWLPERKVWITGSSNFSENGLSMHDEFNVQVSDWGQKEVQAWYDALWEEAVPLTADPAPLVKILREASVAAAVTPFEAYYLVMKQYVDYQKTVLNEERLDRLLKKAGFTRFRYQTDAVAQAMRKLDEHGGVILADVVGLGKSIIAALICALRGKRALIICPPGLMSGWEDYRKRFELYSCEVRSRGKLDAVQEELASDHDFDMVIVDEAHNFRNERTDNYARLADICFGREVVLLTATPFNNSPSDLLALMKLFVPARQSAFGDLETRFRLYQQRYDNLAKLSKAIARKDLAEVAKLAPRCDLSMDADRADGFERISAECRRAQTALGMELKQMMEKVVIRRNRLDLLEDEDYAGEITTLSKVENPREQYFELSPEQNDFYDRVVKEYFSDEGRFHGAFYRPQNYRVNQEGSDDAQTNIYMMLRSQLVQRFESSFGAFLKSVHNVRASMDLALKFIKETGYYLYDRDDMERILAVDDEADMYEAINQAYGAFNTRLALSGHYGNKRYLYRMSDADFRDDLFTKNIQEDMDLMDELIAEVGRLDLLGHDPKAAALVEAVGRVLDGGHPDITTVQDEPRRKVIVFSEFADTITHLKDIVEARFPGRVLVVSGGLGAEKAKTAIANFDASHPVAKQKDDFDILLATDKMSEGFNLNRAGLVINYDIPWNPTRIIQRVGRINRIGKKVFEHLYIFNFFPTLKGSSLVGNRTIAQDKMFAIHQILGEDSRIFTLEETPTPSAMFDKLCSPMDDEDDISLYTRIKKKLAQARKELLRGDPDALERLARLPSMVKTAWQAGPAQTRCTIMFKRSSGLFSAVAYRKEDQAVAEWPFERAFMELECRPNQPAVPLSAEFWRFPKWTKKDPGPRGVYDKLKKYIPQGLREKGGTPDHVVAANFIVQAMADMPYELKVFAGTVVEDIRCYGTIPALTLKRIARISRMEPMKEAVERLEDLLSDLRDMRGDGYLNAVKQRMRDDAIIVTVEKQ